MSRSAVRTRKRRSAHARGQRLEVPAAGTEDEFAVTSDPALAAALAAVEEHAKKKKPEKEGDQADDAEPDADADEMSAEQLAAEAETVAAPEPEVQTNASHLRWEATFAPEGKATDDGRMFWPGSIEWRELPLSLMAMTETPGEGGHAGAELAGRIDNIWREGGVIHATGIFDDGEYGGEIGRLVGDGTLRGLSVDIAAREFEIVAREKLFDEDGELRLDALEKDDEEEPDLMEILFGGEDSVFVVTDGVIGMATVCPFPAFEDAQISLSASGMVWRLHLQGGFTVVREDADGEGGEAAKPDETLTASAAGLAPLQPPSAWFHDPEFHELTPLTVTDEGQVYGHAAAWGTCHTAIPDACTTPPRSTSGYAYFLTGEVETEEGDTVATGRITLATNHADRRLGRQAAAEHYDHTGAVVADVVSGEDEFGIWFAGGLRPEVSAERVREFRGSVLSGDWRGVNGNLELIGLLAVNIPGFPVPRARALVAASDDGPNVLTLVAAGITDGRTVEDLDENDLAHLRALSARARGGIAALAELASGKMHAYEDDGSGHCAECGMTDSGGNHS